MLDKLLKFMRPRPAVTAGQALYAQAVTQSRSPIFYTDYGVKDEIGDRFELLVLHVLIILNALKTPAAEQTEQRKETAQALFDALLLALDDTLREQGVGDLTVPKKMKKLSETVNARLHRWVQIWGEGDEAAQTDYLLKTVYAQAEETEVDARLAEAMSVYVSAARQNLSPAELVAGRIVWADIPQLKQEV